MNPDFTIQLTLPKDCQLPSVAAVELEESDFKLLQEWSQDGELRLLGKGCQGTEFELSCQLSETAMLGEPDEMCSERKLFILLDDSLREQNGNDCSLRLAKREKATVVPKDRQYNPWKNLSGVYVDLQEENDRAIVSIEGALFTRYLYSPSVAKPYLYPLIGPLGKTLVQDAPDDHLHHHGMWWGHDDVNGHKTYHEFRGEGRQIHRRFLVLHGGSVFGQITSLVDWVDEHGGLLLQEVRTVRIYNLPRETRYFDISTQLYTAGGKVVFGDTKEGGFPFLRVNEQINVNHTGTIRASNGMKEEAEIFGSQADWVDYSGQLLKGVRYEDGKKTQVFEDAGIAVFVHPQNEAYARQWFVRNYGPFTPANFHFCGGKVMEPGDVLTMQNRIYIHQGDAEAGAVQDRYKEYTALAAFASVLRS